MLPDLQDHAQAVDPNLLQLAEAYQTAVGKLGGAVERPTAFSQVLVADLLADDTGAGVVLGSAAHAHLLMSFAEDAKPETLVPRTWGQGAAG